MECGAKEEREKKIRRKKGRGRAGNAALSPRSEQLEQAIIINIIIIIIISISQTYSHAPISVLVSPFASSHYPVELNV